MVVFVVVVVPGSLKLFMVFYAIFAFFNDTQIHFKYFE